MMCCQLIRTSGLRHLEPRPMSWGHGGYERSNSNRSQTLHGTGISAYIDPWSTTPGLIGKYASPMECLGKIRHIFDIWL